MTRAVSGSIRSLVFVLGLWASSASLGGQTLEQRVETYLAPYMETGNFSGSLLVAQRGRVLLSISHGTASDAAEIRNSPGTVFHLASVSRVITSLAVMKLAQQGHISTDDPLSLYLPDWPRGDEIRIRDLLTLSAGFPNINELPGYMMWQQMRQTPSSLAAKFRDLPLEFEPGTRSVHSNSNYTVLALLIEMVSGISYGEFLHREIFAPLGMSHSGHDGDASLSDPVWALGHRPAGQTDLTPVPDIDWSVKTGNGSLYSTTEDLYRLDRALADGRFLDASYIDEMFAEYYPDNAYGWFVDDRLGSREVYINGQSPGFGAFWGRSLREDVTVIVLGNIQNGVPTAIGRDLIAMVLGESVTGPIMRSDPPPPRAVLDAVVGTYLFGPDFYRPNASITIGRRGGHLFNGAHWLMPTTRGELTFQHRRYWSILEFRRDASGDVVELRYDDYVGRRVSGPR